MGAQTKKGAEFMHKFCSCLAGYGCDCPKDEYPKMTCKDCLFYECLPCQGCIHSEKCDIRKGNENRKEVK